MDIVKSWVIGAAASVLPFLVLAPFGLDAMFSSVSSGLVAGAVAALVHPAPQRHDLGRHLLATLPAALVLPLVGIASMLRIEWIEVEPAVVIALVIALLAGAVGVALVRLLRRSARVPS